MRRLTFNHLQTILDRQHSANFGSDYIPAMLATRLEGPSKSRPCILLSKKFGRGIHVMSKPEKAAALLALYHPNLAEIHEQKILWPWQYPHPLTGMPGIDSTGLAPVLGTMDVCDRLGYPEFHAGIVVDNPGGGGKQRVPYPFLGDLLLFLRQEEYIYCVNWTIKDKSKNFTAPPPGKRTAASSKSIRKALARSEIEIQYYADAGIRTVQIAEEKINWDVSANLSQLFPYTFKVSSLIAEEERKVVLAFRAALELETPPMEVIVNLAYRGICSAYDARVIFYQAIWNRELRVDFFSPIVPDHPLVPEKRDIIDYYSEWFKP